MYTEMDIRWHAKVNPWFKYVEETIETVRKWYHMTRAQLTEELKKRGLPQQWTQWNRIGQIHRLIAHDFPPQERSMHGEKYLCDPSEFWSRYLEGIFSG